MNSGPRRIKSNTSINTDERERLRALVEQRGEEDAARMAGINPATLARALAGLGIQPGSRALIRIALGLPGVDSGSIAHVEGKQ